MPLAVPRLGISNSWQRRAPAGIGVPSSGPTIWKPGFESPSTTFIIIDLSSGHSSAALEPERKRRRDATRAAAPCDQCLFVRKGVATAQRSRSTVSRETEVWFGDSRRRASGQRSPSGRATSARPFESPAPMSRDLHFSPSLPEIFPDASRCPSRRSPSDLKIEAQQLTRDARCRGTEPCVHPPKTTYLHLDPPTSLTGFRSHRFGRHGLCPASARLGHRASASRRRSPRRAGARDFATSTPSALRERLGSIPQHKHVESSEACLARCSLGVAEVGNGGRVAATKEATSPRTIRLSPRPRLRLLGSQRDFARLRYETTVAAQQ
jgi:hypothetical protein